ncbi:MAG: hypothetical protein J6K48_10600 [Lachnospiraceae bacterium]|nr:hypothetical protein [Lachnospiraceae bacterium]
MEDRKENATYGLNEPYQNNMQYEQNVPYQQNTAYEQNIPYQQNTAYEQNIPYQQNTVYGQNVPYQQNAPYGQNMPYGQNAPYGQPQYNQPVRAVVRDTMPVKNNAGIVGFVIACFSILCCWIPIFDLVFSILGIVCSAIGLGKTKQTGKGLATAGLVVSIIALLLSLIICFLVFLGMSL